MKSVLLGSDPVENLKHFGEGHKSLYFLPVFEWHGFAIRFGDLDLYSGSELCVSEWCGDALTVCVGGIREGTVDDAGFVSVGEGDPYLIVFVDRLAFLRTMHDTDAAVWTDL